MRDTGFIGMRLAGYPKALESYGLTAVQMEREFARRNLHLVTISFSAPFRDPAQRKAVMQSARGAMEFLRGFGANHLVAFSPGRNAPGAHDAAAFQELCSRYNEVGELAGEMGFTAGVHNHLGEMVESPEEVERCLARTDRKLFGFSPDTAHLHLAGGNVGEILRKHKTRIHFLDYKDARWTTPDADWVEGNGKVLPKDSPGARFQASIYDLGDGEVDFPECHRILKSVSYRGWICVDLDTALQGPRASYEHCGAYVTSKLEPIYR
jgi:inosose dehydratase